MRDLIIECWENNILKYDFIHDHFGFECDSCGLIPERIYLLWLNDIEKKRKYLRYECFNCMEKNINTKQHLNSFISLVRITSYCNFPNIDKIDNILFVAKYFLMRKNNEYIKARL